MSSTSSPQRRGSESRDARPPAPVLSRGRVDAVTGPDIASISGDWERELPGLDISLFQLSSLLTRIADLIEQEFARVASGNELRPGHLRVPIRARRRIRTTSAGSGDLEPDDAEPLIGRLDELYDHVSRSLRQETRRRTPGGRTQ